MKNYKVVINTKSIAFFILIALIVYILEQVNMFNGGKILSYLIFGFMLYNVVRFYCKEVFEITFVNEEIILAKYSFFKKKNIKIQNTKVAYKYKKRISYPNTYYELIFVYGNDEILVNSNIGNFFSFSDNDEKAILNKLEELNIQKIN